MDFDAVSFGAGVALSAVGVVLYRAASRPKAPKDKPRLIYFPLAGRGEISRLIAVAGGLEIEDISAPDARKPFTDNKAAYGSPSGLPLLEHGELKISQSTAVATYLATLAPKFANLTPAQRAQDNMFLSIKEDVYAASDNHSICGS